MAGISVEDALPGVPTNIEIRARAHPPLFYAPLPTPNPDLQQVELNEDPIEIAPEVPNGEVVLDAVGDPEIPTPNANIPSNSTSAETFKPR